MTVLSLSPVPAHKKTWHMPGFLASIKSDFDVYIWISWHVCIDESTANRVMATVRNARLKHAELIFIFVNKSIPRTFYRCKCAIYRLRYMKDTIADKIVIPKTPYQSE